MNQWGIVGRIDELRLPDFLILGAPKSASTWLHWALRAHPQVYMPPLETSFFLEEQYRENDVAMLARELRPAPRNALMGIKHPEYFGRPECAQRIARDIPAARLIVILRNPVDRALSHYFHNIRGGRLAYTDPDKAFAGFLAGEFPQPYLKQHILGFGFYAEALAQYLVHFRPSNILLLTDIDDKKSNYRKACEFLGISGADLPSGFDVPRNQGVYSGALLRAIGALNRQCYTFDSVSGSATYRNNWRSRLASGGVKALIRASAIGRFAGLLPPARLSSDIRARLLNYYLSDIERLEGMTGWDLSPWKRMPSSS